MMMAVVRSFEELAVQNGRPSIIKDAKKYAEELGLQLWLNFPNPVAVADGKEVEAKKVKQAIYKAPFTKVACSALIKLQILLTMRVLTKNRTTLFPKTHVLLFFLAISYSQICVLLERKKLWRNFTDNDVTMNHLYETSISFS